VGTEVHRGAFSQCVGPLCYDFSDVEEYMNKATTMKDLGVPEGRT